MDDPDQTIDRRQILQAIGSGAVSVGLAGVAGATPGKGKGPDDGKDRGGGVGPCTCEEGCSESYGCGKVDGAPEKDETYTFSSGGEEFSVTIDDVEKKDGGEIIGFKFSTTDDVEKVCVKGGPDTKTHTGSELDDWLRAPTNPGGKQPEISNFSFCGQNTTYYQIDFVKGEPICDLGGSDGETYGGDRLLRVLAVSEDGTVTQENENAGTTADSCIDAFVDELSFDESTQGASVTVDVADEECTLSLVGYRLPDGCTKFEECQNDPQTLLACQVESYTGGETGQTFSIDLDDGDCAACSD